MSRSIPLRVFVTLFTTMLERVHPEPGQAPRMAALIAPALSLSHSRAFVGVVPAPVVCRQ